MQRCLKLISGKLLRTGGIARRILAELLHATRKYFDSASRRYVITLTAGVAKSVLDMSAGAQTVLVSKLMLRG